MGDVFQQSTNNEAVQPNFSLGEHKGLPPLGHEEAAYVRFARSPDQMRRGLHIAHPVNHAASQDGISLVEDHRLGRRYGGGVGRRSTGQVGGLPDLGVGPLGKVINAGVKCDRCESPLRHLLGLSVLKKTKPTHLSAGGGLSSFLSM